MHAGKITNKDTAAGRVYAILVLNMGLWWSGWELTLHARCTAIGTRISEIRHQLPPGQHLEIKTADMFGNRGVWYRIVEG